jgi:hypothetical protein
LAVERDKMLAGTCNVLLLPGTSACFLLDGVTYVVAGCCAARLDHIPVVKCVTKGGEDTCVQTSDEEASSCEGEALLPAAQGDEHDRSGRAWRVATIKIYTSEMRILLMTSN